MILLSVAQSQMGPVPGAMGQVSALVLPPCAVRSRPNGRERVRRAPGIAVSSMTL